MNVAIIPARGGSKGIPGKNIKCIQGKPLIAWSIEAALKSRLIDRVVVSTDDPEIEAIARKFGAEVIIRPSYLATDEATTISVLEHLAGLIPDANIFVVLQPTSPIRKDGLIDDCVDFFLKSDATNLATGFWCKYSEFGSHNNLRRQDMKGFFYDDGNIYILPLDLVRKGQWFGDKILKYEIDSYQSYEIDDEVDFYIVEHLLARYLSNTK